MRPEWVVVAVFMFLAVGLCLTVVAMIVSEWRCLDGYERAAAVGILVLCAGLVFAVVAVPLPLLLQ